MGKYNLLTLFYVLTIFTAAIEIISAVGRYIFQLD